MSNREPRVWKVAPGRRAAYWDSARDRGFIGINWLAKTDLRTFPGVGDLRRELTKVSGKGGGASSVWQFVHDFRRGDIVVANRGKSAVVGVGVVTGDYLPPTDPSNPGLPGLAHLRAVEWRVTAPVDLPDDFFPMNTVTPLRPGQWDQIRKAYLAAAPELRPVLDGLGSLDGGNGADPPAVDKLLAAVRRTRNVILCGPPGTGKTYAVQRFAARHAPGRTRFVTFHPSYTYEEFVEGLRPAVTGGQLSYDVRPGAFRLACRAAAADPGHDHLLVVDEINRANVAKVFGELITLVEDDKRAGRANALAVTLPYSGDELCVPANLTVVGTMNTADRSIALLDHALRRRFTFIELPPEPGLLGTVERVDLAAVLRGLNRRVAAALDRDHQVGHSYLLGAAGAADLHFAWYARVVPLLREYFHGDSERLRKVFGDAFVREAGGGGEFDGGDRPQVEVCELHGQAFLDALAAIGNPAGS